jgi:hypothetical protein
MTANSLNLADDIARRSIPIQLDAHMEDPHRRDPSMFRHPSLSRWIRDSHGELVWACLTLVRAWQTAGSPVGSASLGSYEEWASIMGGILAVAGIDGFLTNLDRFYQQFDTETSGWKEFVAAWWRENKDRLVRASDLLAAYDTCNDDFLFVGGGDERIRAGKLGYRLLGKRDVIVGSWRITLVDKNQGGNRWKLTAIDEGEGRESP